jgi:cell division septum initiation protein DivIVA
MHAANVKCYGLNQENERLKEENERLKEELARLKEELAREKTEKAAMEKVLSGISNGPMSSALVPAAQVQIAAAPPPF